MNTYHITIDEEPHDKWWILNIYINKESGRKLVHHSSHSTLLEANSQVMMVLKEESIK